MTVDGITPMTLAAAGTLLLLVLPFLLSLAAQGAMPKVLCFVTSMLTLLLSVEPYRAVLPWAVGMAIAVIAVRERIRQHWPV
jgi:hypothetical protein